MRATHYYKFQADNVVLNAEDLEVMDHCNYIFRSYLSEKNDPVENEIQIIQSSQHRYYLVKANGKTAREHGYPYESLIPKYLVTKAVENIIFYHYRIFNADTICLHSCSVSKDNKGIFIVGESGHGKSTLTLEMVAHHGWSYLSDEVGLLDAKHVIHPFLKTVSCKQLGIVRLDPSWPVRSFGADHQIAVPKEKHGSPALLHAIFFVRYSPDKEPSIEPVKKSAALLRLMNAQIGRAKSVATIEQMAEVVKKADAFQIVHNNAAAAARLLTERMAAA